MAKRNKALYEQLDRSVPGWDVDPTSLISDEDLKPPEPQIDYSSIMDEDLKQTNATPPFDAEKMAAGIVTSLRDKSLAPEDVPKLLGEYGVQYLMEVKAALDRIDPNGESLKGDQSLPMSNPAQQEQPVGAPQLINGRPDQQAAPSKLSDMHRRRQKQQY